MIRTIRTPSRTWALAALGALLLAIALGISSARATPAAAAGSVTLCRDIGFVGCTTFTADVASLSSSMVGGISSSATSATSATALGNDQASSLKVSPGSRVVLFSDANYRGTCQEFSGDVSTLVDTLIGNDRVSSLKLNTGNCFMGSTVWLETDRFWVPAARTISKTYSCPSGRTVGEQGEYAAIPFTNNSDSGVAAYMGGGGYGSQSLTINFHNWNAYGAVAGAKVACHDDYVYLDDSDTNVTALGPRQTVPVSLRYGGNWTYSANRGLGDYGDDAHIVTNTSGNYMDIYATFTARGFEVIAEKTPDGGTIDISLQATNCGTTYNPRFNTSAGADVNLASPTLLTQQVIYSYETRDGTCKYDLTITRPMGQGTMVFDLIRIKPE